MPEEPSDKTSPEEPTETASAEEPAETTSAEEPAETTSAEDESETRSPQEPEPTPASFSKGRRAAQAAGLAALAVVLVGGGFLIGRASEDGGSKTVTTTVAGGGGPTYDPSKSKATYNGNDVVKAFPPVIIRDGEILAEKKGSPERALLEWWQAYQFDDVEAVLSLTSKETIDAIGEDKLRQLVLLPGPGLQGLEVLNASESGATASVNAGLLSFQPENPGDPVPTEPTNSTPETFAMQKEAGDWHFAATDYLSLKLNALPE